MKTPDANKQRSEKELSAVWHFLTAALDFPIRRLLNYSYEDFDIGSIDGPVIVIPNHTCAWDSLIMAIAMKDRQMRFVMTENMLRKKFIGPLIAWVDDPIPRKKASTGSGTVMACLRHLKAGHSICLFAEGEQTWNGLTGPVFPATGKLVKKSGATLITYRIEGGYLALPRWAKGIRKGRVYGHPVNVYSPDTLKSMTADEITEAIDRDIFFDIWKWQKEQPGGPVRFKGRGKSKDLAEGLDKSLFICPECKRMGTMSASGNELTCSCGARTIYGETGFLGGGRFHTLADWDVWQKEELAKQLNALIESSSHAPDDVVDVYTDGIARLSVVEDGHKDTLITEGPLRLTAENGSLMMRVGDEKTDLSEIRMMAPVLSSTLLFMTEKGYFEIRATDTIDINIRKYLLAWQYISDRVEE